MKNKDEEKRLLLTPAERAALQSILQKQSERAKFTITLNWLLKEWANFVRSVERGYDDYVYEYINDLSTRDLIKEICDANSGLAIKLKLVIEPLDRRFYTSTREINRSLSGDGSERWQKRIPLKMGAKLEEDLSEEDLSSR